MESEEQVVGWEALPEEVKWMVLESLDPPQITSARLVSIGWKRIVDSNRTSIVVVPPLPKGLDDGSGKGKRKGKGKGDGGNGIDESGGEAEVDDGNGDEGKEE
jgi:hypothetical protein